MYQASQHPYVPNAPGACSPFTSQAGPGAYRTGALLILLLSTLSLTPVSAEASSDPVIRINAGGGAYTDSAGHRWSADSGFNTGRASDVSGPIGATEDDALFQTKRWDPPAGAELAYAFELPNGDYQVRLHFAETYRGTFGVGRRVFDVLLENQRVADNLDVYKAVGANTALTHTFPVTVQDGQLNLAFAHEVENPMVSAIEIAATTPSAIKPDHGTVTIEADAPAHIQVLAGAGSVKIVARPAHGTVSVAPDRTLLYTPTPGYSGQDSLTYKTVDAHGNVTLATLTLKVGCTECRPEVPWTLSWTPAPSPVAGYRIYFGATPDTATRFFTDLHIASGEVKAKAPSVTYRAGADLGMYPGDSACFRVTAYNPSGESKFSESICGTL